jgi:hypothetical protein
MLKVRAWRVVACGGWQTNTPKRNITIVCIFIIELTGYDQQNEQLCAFLFSRQNNS